MSALATPGPRMQALATPGPRMQAHFPSLEDVEEISKQATIPPEVVLAIDPNFISIKRELFIYGLSRSIEGFLDIIRSLDFKRGQYPVQEIPLILAGGVASSLVTRTQPRTPDIDIELSPFDIRASRNRNQNKTRRSESDKLFMEYVNSLFDEICIKIHERQGAFGVYDEDISEVTAKRDPELHNNTVRGQVVDNLYVGLVINLSFFSKIVVVAKMGAFTERIIEIKLPKNAFGDPIKDIELTSHVGLYCQSPDKMIADNTKSMNDKLRKMQKAMVDYANFFREPDKPEGRQHPYWIQVEQQKREAIITYKVRILSHVDRLTKLIGSFDPALVDPAYQNLFDKLPKQLSSYITPQERAEVEGALVKAQQEQQVEAEAAAAALEEGRWEKPKRVAKRVNGSGKESRDVSPTLVDESGFAALRDNGDEEVLPPVLVKVSGVATTAASVAATAATAVAAAAPVAITATATTAATSAAAAAPQEMVYKPDKIIVFVEKKSVEYSTVFNNINVSLNHNYAPKEGEHRVFCLEINTRDRRLPMERQTLPNNFYLCMDSDSLIGAETITFKLLPYILSLHKKGQVDISTNTYKIVDLLYENAWYINNKTFREAHHKQFLRWRMDANKEGKIMSRDFLKITYETLFIWIHSLLNTIYMQENENTKTFGYILPDPFKINELDSVFKTLIDYIGSQKVCPCNIPEELLQPLAVALESSFIRMKSRSLLTVMEKEYTQFYIDTLHTRTKSTPILFISDPQPYSKIIIDGILFYFNMSEISTFNAIFNRTNQFFNNTPTQTPEEHSFMTKCAEFFSRPNDYTLIHLEILIELTEPLWGQLTPETDTKKIKQKMCRFFIFLLENKEFLNINDISFWAIRFMNFEGDNFIDLITPIYTKMEERQHERKALFTDIILKKMIDDKIKSQKEHDKEEEATLKLAKFEEEKEAADKAAAELEAEIAAEEAAAAAAKNKKKGKAKGKGKGGYRKTRKLRQRI